MKNLQTLLVKMKYVISTKQEQMLLLVLNQPVTTYAKQIMALMSYQIALPVMIKGKLTKCYVIMKVKAVKSLV